ncbi:hypothetical protein ACLHDG_13730 [Sulfurovum sp. CS9]|uniref:AMIN-like domain-containing (lipo)protein n=1 Tax=Sulfurovum sp. CS9 TaxID=3391146 RepID=UPI0039E8422B
MTSHTMAFMFRMMLVLSLTVGVSEGKPIQVLSGGTISDGLDLSHIRIGEHTGYTRIVFDVQYWEGYGAPKAGTSSDNAGHYTFTLEQNHSIEVEFSGFRSSSAKDVTVSEHRLVQSIKMLRGEAYGDDSSVFYRIRLRGPARLRVFHLYNPARIVLDIYMVE